MLNILISIPVVLYVPLKIGTLLWLIPVSGLAGIYLFRGKLESSPDHAKVTRSIPGDGTNRIVNVFPWLLGVVGGLLGFNEYARWRVDKDVAGSHGLPLYFEITITLLLVTLIHETGHAIAAWGVKMKIRAFVVGPFQWQMREGKWGFSFNVAQMFSAGGATGAVHTDPHQPVWCDLFMIVAGPLANLASGTLALCTVYLVEPDSPIQIKGMLLLFGFYSLLAFATNLIPFRTGEQYSDGARIYQLLSGGPFASLHGAFSLVLSSLVTPLRPRDYNLSLFERAATGAAQSKQLMLLHLYRYQYHLDWGELAEAAQALNEAEAIYHQYAAEIPAELHSGFVFGNAYGKRDALSAREWWRRMEEKKPTRFNADYWLAHSALHWIEGDLYMAKDSWFKGAAMADRLPKAGAYEFDRYLFFLLHQAMDEVPATV